MNATIAIIIAAISFSFYPLLYATAMETTSNYLLALIAQVITSLFSFILLCHHLKSFAKVKSLVHSYCQLPWDVQIIPILSGTGTFVGTLFFIFALEMMSKAGATLIMECWPLMAILVSRSLLTRKDWDSFRALDAVLILITLCGLTLITASEAGLSFESFFKHPLILFENRDIKELFGVILSLLAALCFAWGGVSRSYFVTLLSDEMRQYYFGKTNSIAEANFTFMMAFTSGIPAALLCFVFFEKSPIEFSTSVTLPVIFIAISLVITSAFYAYAILIARNANINLLWYIAPVLATIWLVLFDYSTVTPLLFLGGFLIILANIILILTNKKETKEVLQ